MDSILDVDLIGFESGDARRRSAIVDGVMRSLETGFVYVEHDLDEAELDACYAQLETFFGLPLEAKRKSAVPGSRGQRGYTGLLVEKAASSDAADWKEHLNWGEAAPPDTPSANVFPTATASPSSPKQNCRASQKS